LPLSPEKLVQRHPTQRPWLPVAVVTLLLAAAALALTWCRQHAPVAGKYYAHQLRWEHGLNLGDSYAGEAAFTGALQQGGFALSRRLGEDDFEFVSPGSVYLLRVKTDGRRITSLYHYLRDDAHPPPERPCFLGSSRQEVRQALGVPTRILREPVLTFRYELADADLSLAFGGQGWVVESVLQRPISRRPSGM